MALTPKERAARLEELRKAREEKAAEKAAERLTARGAAIEKTASEYYGVTPVKVGATTQERVEALKDIRAAENLATYTTASGFTAIPYAKLDPAMKGVISANASSLGITPEQYYTSRGGVNKSGYYGDSYTANLTLTEREYQIARLEGGIGTTGAGEAINRASKQKAYNYYISQGDNPVKASIRSGFTKTSMQVKSGASPKGGNLYLLDNKYYDDAGNELNESIGSSLWSSSVNTASTINADTGFFTSSTVTDDTTVVDNTLVENNSTDDTLVNGGKTTNIDVLKSLLRGMGFSTSLIDSSANYLNRLLKDGLDYDNAIAIFLDSKEYTFKNGQKVISPFYTSYGYLNEGLTTPKTASELFNAVEGYKGVVAKYSLSDKYLSSDSLKKYVKNNVSVSELDERANAARLKAINADKSYTNALQMLGYIKSPTDLTDFFLNPDIGKEKLEQNRSTAAFSAEAIRRAQQGIKFDATRFGEITAGLLGRGLSEEEIGVTAAKGFENIGEQLAPTTKLAQIYERMPATEAIDIQKELEAEQFLGTASQRRKRVKELEESAFQRAPGTTTSSLRTSRAGII